VITTTARASAAAEPRPSRKSIVTDRVVTSLFVAGPVIALAVAIPLLWGNALNLHDVILAAVFYLIAGFGISIGFHRLFTHRSFKPNRPLKFILAAAGSMAFEGSVTSWVANHRRHHMFSDQPGDPHSPHRYGTGPMARVRGLAYAHVGWLFTPDTTSKNRFAADLLRDNDIVISTRLFPLFAALSFAIPFGIGWGITGTFTGALTALLWAGLVRMAVFHHVTWSINSICHMFGTKPFATKDQSTNFAPLALLSLGESWHSYHHLHPASARHGVLPHQIDLSARMIRWFEQAGWATRVHWPAPAALLR
jgi:stearoyl-CoA desaturase (delta-9 desaturase)